MEEFLTLVSVSMPPPPRGSKKQGHNCIPQHITLIDPCKGERVTSLVLGRGQLRPVPSSALQAHESTADADVDINVRLRDPNNNNCEVISRKHAALMLTNSGSRLVQDLQSVNGVYLNDVRVTQAELRDGDVLQLGGCSNVPIGARLPPGGANEIHVRYKYHSNISQLIAPATVCTGSSAGKASHAELEANGKRKLDAQMLETPILKSSRTDQCAASIAKPVTLEKQWLTSSGPNNDEGVSESTASKAVVGNLSIVSDASRIALCDTSSATVHGSRAIVALQSNEKKMSLHSNTTRIDAVLPQQQSYQRSLIAKMSCMQSQLERKSCELTHALEQLKQRRKEAEQQQQRADSLQARLDSAMSSLQEKSAMLEEMTEAIERLKSAKSASGTASRAVPRCGGVVSISSVAAPAAAISSPAKSAAMCRISSSTLQSALKCILCKELLLDAVYLTCSHGFCRICITRHWQSQRANRSPDGTGSIVSDAAAGGAFDAVHCPTCRASALPAWVSSKFNRRALGDLTRDPALLEAACCQRNDTIDSMVWLLLESGDEQQRSAFEMREAQARQQLQQLRMNPDLVLPLGQLPMLRERRGCKRAAAASAAGRRLQKVGGKDREEDGDGDDEEEDDGDGDVGDECDEDRISSDASSSAVGCSFWAVDSEEEDIDSDEE